MAGIPWSRMVPCLITTELLVLFLNNIGHAVRVCVKLGGRERKHIRRKNTSAINNSQLT